MKSLRSAGVVAAVLAALALGGCATTVYEGKYDWGEGWRKAKVVQVQTAAEMARPAFYTCVRNASAEQRARERFAVVEYRRTSRTLRHAALVRPGDQVGVGDTVYVDVDDCARPVAAATKPNF
jgi:hypothetical protein